MKINASAEYVRQQKSGTFKRPDDGKEPFPHINNTRVDSPHLGANRAVYVKGEKTGSLANNVLGKDFPKLFDYDAGLKRAGEKVTVKSKETKSTGLYTGAEKKTYQHDEDKPLFDEWV